MNSVDFFLLFIRLKSSEKVMNFSLHETSEPYFDAMEMSGYIWLCECV